MKSISLPSQIVDGREIISRAITVADGRQVAFSTYGATVGPTLFYLHGSGSCRFEALRGADAAAAAGVRLIAPDRPGFGRSDPRPGRTIAQGVEDILAIADALDVDRFAVAGLSGGAPHALASAIGQPGRVRKAIMLNTAGDPHHPAWRRVSWAKRQSMLLMTRGWIARRIYGQLARDPAGAIRTSRHVAQLDRALALIDGGALIDGAFREGNRQGLDALLYEARMFYHRPWGLDWDALRRPVAIVQGREDPNLPFVRGLAAMYPDRVTLQEVPGGHLGTGAPAVWQSVIALAAAD